MSGLRLWIVLLSAVSFLAGIPAGVLIAEERRPQTGCTVVLEIHFITRIPQMQTQELGDIHVVLDDEDATSGRNRHACFGGSWRNSTGYGPRPSATSRLDNIFGLLFPFAVSCYSRERPCCN